MEKKISFTGQLNSNHILWSIALALKISQNWKNKKGKGGKFYFEEYFDADGLEGSFILRLSGIILHAELERYVSVVDHFESVGLILERYLDWGPCGPLRWGQSLNAGSHSNWRFILNSFFNYLWIVEIWIFKAGDIL